MNGGSAVISAWVRRRAGGNAHVIALSVVELAGHLATLVEDPAEYAKTHGADHNADNETDEAAYKHDTTKRIYHRPFM